MEERKLNFRPAWVVAVKPEAVPVEWSDEAQRGLVLRIQPTGRKTWIARYWFNGRDRRYKLGTYPELRLKAARDAARRMLGLAQNGQDPQLERDRLRVGAQVSATVAAWLDDAKQGPAARWKGGLEGGSARSFLPHVRRFQSDLGERRLSVLTPKEIERFVSAPEAAATRNRALTALRGFFRWALRKGLVHADPSAGLGKEREAERARTLTDEELHALIHGFDATRYGRAVRLLALTGLRRDEVLGACWSWLDADAGVLTVPPESEKTGRSRGEPRRVALSPAAVALLAEQRRAQFGAGIRSEFIFATASGERPHADALKPILYKLRGLRSNGQPASTDKRAKPRPASLAADATIHDLRRTVADALLNRLGVAPWVVDHVVLGHVRPKLLRTYMPVLPLEEARAALTRWAGELDRIAGTSTQRDAR
jgi:integrase